MLQHLKHVKETDIVQEGGTSVLLRGGDGQGRLYRSRDN